MVKHWLCNTRTTFTTLSALNMVGWLAAFTGWLLPSECVAVKVACLSVARVLP